MPKIKTAKFDLPKLVISIIICQSAGVVGSIFTISSIPTWYRSLIKPNFAPPNWIFGPVWLILYTLMGVSFYLIWQKGLGKSNVKDALSFFTVHLLINASWSIIFFGLKSPSLALVNIIILLLMIVISIKKFHKIDNWAGMLLWPYLAWVSFATFLNYSIWILNR